MAPLRDPQVTGPSRILVVRTDRLGDVVLTLPVFSHLRRRYPEAHLALLAGQYAGAIVTGSPQVDEIIWYDAPEGPIPVLEMVRRLCAGRFDAAVVVHPTARLALIVLLAGIPLRIGSGYRWYSFLFNRRVYTHRKTAERHEVEYNVDLLAALDCDTAARKPLEAHLRIPAGAQAGVDARLRGAGVAGEFAVIHPGSGGSAREWPEERFAALARKIVSDIGLAVVTTGTAGESPRAEAVARAAGPRGVCLAGALSLGELAALISRAALVVGNSTGPLHLGVALGVPVLGFYPGIPVMGPVRWGPYTDRARVLVAAGPPDCSDCDGTPGSRCLCMEGISVETAFVAARELLEKRTITEHQSTHES
ncbi:MAG TPA: glycosyltransferase family 9 protein [Bacteroidota bacterium]|nr:glycosyltransferase family 9 protein [Bacteroidota bacterium]